MRTHFHLCCAAIALLLIGGCRNKTVQPDDQTASDSLTTDKITTERDSCFYGISGAFGMSTFTLITDQGDTLHVARTGEDGTDGKIYGHLREGERYAMTTRDSNRTIATLLNLTQLERFMERDDYSVWNGKLILTDSAGNADTAVIEKLSRDTFKASGRQIYEKSKR